ncbi:hypothetical protein GGF32_006222 [Allomyces javanicus]|nr:hypothetical protein GGF32_006222 [Allomyces javanicus]
MAKKQSKEQDHSNDPNRQPLSAPQELFLKRLFYERFPGAGYHALYEAVVREAPSTLPHIYRNQVREWLNTQELYQRNKQPPPKRDIRRIQATSVSRVYQLDLIDMGEGRVWNGFRYILNVVDVASRKLFLEPLKKKTEDTVYLAFKKIAKHEHFGNKPTIHMDNGAVDTTKRGDDKVFIRKRKVVDGRKVTSYDNPEIAIELSRQQRGVLSEYIRARVLFNGAFPCEKTLGKWLDRVKRFDPGFQELGLTQFKSLMSKYWSSMLTDTKNLIRKSIIPMIEQRWQDNETNLLAAQLLSWATCTLPGSKFQTSNDSIQEYQATMLGFGVVCKQGSSTVAKFAGPTALAEKRLTLFCSLSYTVFGEVEPASAALLPADATFEE